MGPHLEFFLESLNIIEHSCGNYSIVDTFFDFSYVSKLSSRFFSKRPNWSYDVIRAMTEGRLYSSAWRGKTFATCVRYDVIRRFLERGLCCSDRAKIFRSAAQPLKIPNFWHLFLIFGYLREDAQCFSDAFLGSCRDIDLQKTYF